MWLIKWIDREKLYFLCGGFLNTSLTLLLYNVLLYICSYQVSYFISYTTGIVVSYVFNSYVTFRSIPKKLEKLANGARQKPGVAMSQTTLYWLNTRSFASSQPRGFSRSSIGQLFKFLRYKQVRVVKFLQIYLLYGASGSLGYLVLTYCVQKLLIPEILAPVLVILLLIPINFIGVKLVLTTSRSQNYH